MTYTTVCGMREVDLAYIAGLIDGEAYIGIKKSTYHSRVLKDGINPEYHERIQIRMTNEKAIKFIQELLGGNYYKEKCASLKSGKFLYCYQASDRKAANILKKLLPFLKVKRKETELVLKLRESKEDHRSFRRGSPARRPMPKDIVEYREHLYQAIKKVHS